MEPIICLITTMTFLYFLVREVEVHKFKEELTYKCNDVCSNFINSIPSDRDTTAEEEEYYDYLRSVWMSIEDISKYKMLFSFKPLQERYWLNEEQLKFLGL